MFFREGLGRHEFLNPSLALTKSLAPWEFHRNQSKLLDKKDCYKSCPTTCNLDFLLGFQCQTECCSHASWIKTSDKSKNGLFLDY